MPRRGRPFDPGARAQRERGGMAPRRTAASHHLPKVISGLGPKSQVVQMKRPLMKRGGHFRGEAQSTVANKKHDRRQIGSPESGGGGGGVAVAGEGWRCDRPAERETNETMRKDEKIED